MTDRSREISAPPAGLDAAKPSGGHAGPGAPAPRLLEFAARAMGGRWLGSPPPEAAVFVGAAFDTRSLRPGELFFALRGERADGRDFCAAAAAAGAAALVVDAARGLPPGLPARDPDPTPVIAVADPLAALADLARAIRASFAGRVVGITGSNGKTTTRQLTAAALGSSGAVLSTPGNFNTDIGLPLTIIGSSGREAFWVLEMAMRGRGQIALLADIARPHVGVITNVAGAHLELLGSLAEVARAKGELFAALGDDGRAIFPGGDALIEAEAARLPEAHKLRFEGEGAEQRRSRPTHAGGSGGVPLDVVILDIFPNGVAGQTVRYAVRGQPVVARLPLGGLHNARNGAAALAVAAALGLPIPAAARALADTVLPAHRSAGMKVADRIVVDDCYNANPASMRAALDALGASVSDAGGRGRAFAILGDMLEIGAESAALHRDIGREAGRWLAGLGVVGQLGGEIAGGAREAGLDEKRIVASADDPAAVAAVVASWSRPGDWILVKASRGMRLEWAVDALVEEFRKQPAMT